MKIILEMANNHKGSVEWGKLIIQTYASIAKCWPDFEFAMKFQRRNLSSIVHADYLDNKDYPYLARFCNTQLTFDELHELVTYAEKHEFTTLCTPFDEPSVEEVSSLFTQIKIGSCSANDWPLLHAIAKTKLPVILSTGGLDCTQIANAVSFFQHREIPLTIMHCVGSYPSETFEMNLNMIDSLRIMYPNIEIGLSSHEEPKNRFVGSLAVAKGVRIFERHIDIDHKDINAYSLNPYCFEEWLAGLRLANIACGKGNIFDRSKEQEKLRTFARGAFLKHDVVAGEKVTVDDLYFAMPTVGPNHITAAECSKYHVFEIKEPMLLADSPLLEEHTIKFNHKCNIQHRVDQILNILRESNVTIPPNVELEISHHYGLEKFHRHGMGIITLINEEYCKKLLVVLPGQTNPEHYHKVKKETFFVTHASAIITVGKTKHYLKRGQAITIQPGQKHSISSITGAIIEELSTNHQPNDSFYTDDSINQNSHRKTVVYI